MTARSDRGSAAMTLVLSVSLGAIVATAGVIAIVDLAATAARARTAADAAALAGAATSPLVAEGAGDPRKAAAGAATANEVRLVRVDDDRWPLRFGVTVQARPATPWVRRVVGPLTASATAGVRPTERSALPRGAGSRRP